MKAHWLTRHWAQRDLASRSLLPLAAVYCALMRLRSRRPTARFSVPVVVVGNITVGGTGKTPLVAWLAEWLARAGYRPGIVLRGYGGRSRSWPQCVAADTDPLAVGDEAVLLARRGWPVVAGPDRVLAVETLLHRFSCDIVLSDDGLQHYRLARDLEICVIGRNRFGNGYCLPAGPLREPLSRLERVDARVTQGRAQPGEWRMRMRADGFFCVADPSARRMAADFANAKLCAVAGIGDPGGFFGTLKELGLDVESRSFADHHRFRARDFGFLGPQDAVVMTEKDAVKCAPFADRRFWFLRVRADVEPAFGSWLLDVLKERERRG